ncbi:HK97-gp10 family putative phage morphogenesis protein [Lacunimicrobium album]
MAKFKVGIGIQKKFDELPKEVKRELGRIMKTELKPLKEEAEFQTPVDSGEMEESYKIVTKSREKWIGADLVLQTKDVFYGRFVEFGTQFQEPQHPMGNASTNEGPTVAENIAEKIRDKISSILTK